MKAKLYYWIVFLLGVSFCDWIMYEGTQSIVATIITTLVVSGYLFVLSGAAIHMHCGD